MSDDRERVDPKGTMDTLPPPQGASDAYSAATRVGTLPEHVLEAMRKHEPDAALERRTKSGMQQAVVTAPKAPLLPTFATPRPAPARPAVRPSGQHRVQAPPQLAPPSPLSPLMIRSDAPAESGPVSRPLPISATPPAIPTPQDGWLSAPPPPASGLQPTSLGMRAVPPMEAPQIVPMPPTLISVRPVAPRGSLVRSLVIVALFAVLGAIVAVALLAFMGR